MTAIRMVFDILKFGSVTLFRIIFGTIAFDKMKFSRMAFSRMD
jgi:hypothetical protein